MYIPRQFALSDDEAVAALQTAGFAYPVTELTDHHERDRPTPWQVNDAP